MVKLGIALISIIGEQVEKNFSNKQNLQNPKSPTFANFLKFEVNNLLMAPAVFSIFSCHMSQDTQRRQLFTVSTCKRCGAP